jgi:hypothetical protein
MLVNNTTSWIYLFLITDTNVMYQLSPKKTKKTWKKEKHKHTHIIEKSIPKCAIIRWIIILLQGKKEFNGRQKKTQVSLHIANYIV